MPIHRADMPIHRADMPIHRADMHIHRADMPFLVICITVAATDGLLVSERPPMLWSLGIS